MNESYYEALDDIKNEIRANHIKLIIKRSNDNFYALVFPTCPMIVVNTNNVTRTELPIVLLHEFAHVLLHTDYDYYNRIFDNKCQVEDKANTLATRLALKILIDNDGYIEDFNNSEELRENLGMPNYFEENIEQILKNK